MINFVSSLPQTLEANGIYFVLTSVENSQGELYVGDKNGNAVSISTVALSQAHINSLKGAANGIAGLNADSKLSTSVMPDGFQTAAQISATIQTAIDGLVSSAPGALDTLNELAAALGDDANFASTVNNALAGKQASLSNASEVAKIGNGTFDSKPMILLNTVQW